jgi:hypothetical protein
MDPGPESIAETAARMTAWVNEPGLPGSHANRPALSVAARSLALSYVAGAAGPVSARDLAKRIGIAPRRFYNYTRQARLAFGLRNPWFSSHAWQSWPKTARRK